MHIVLLGPYPPPHGGVQTHIVALREYLMSRGDTCSVINITRHRSATGPGIHHPTSALDLIAVLRGLRPDVVHLHVGGPLPLRVLALALACTQLGPRSIFTFHSGGYPSSPEARTASPATLRGWILRQFDHVIAVNPELGALFARFGVPARRISVIEPHAVGGLEPLRPEDERPVLDAFVAAHPTLLLSVGLLEPEYDVPAQIRALEALLPSRPDAGLLLIGSGSLEGDLRALIAASPSRDHILLAGDVPHRRTLHAIASCSMLLRTTLYDGDAISVREALALGTPVIGTDNGMRPAGVHLVPLRNDDALQAMIRQVLGAPRVIAARGEHDAHENLARVAATYAG
jgi:glycosyltransferase involved in cell wall biosynthesis